MANEENFDLSFLDNANLGQAPVQPNVQPNVQPVQPQGVQQTVTQPQPMYNQPQVAPVQPTVSNPNVGQSTTSVVNPVQPAAMPEPLPEDTIEEAEELAAMYKPASIKMGTQYSSYPLPKFKSKDSITSRISIIGDPFVVEIHYHEGARKSVVCTTKQGGSGLCCQLLPTAAVRYCFPIVKHSVGMDGMTKVPGEPQVEILAIGYSGYQSLAQVYKSQGNTFEGYDILVDTSDARYQKNSYTATRETYLTPDMKQKALAYFNKYADKAYQAIGKLCTDAEIRQIASTQAPVPPPDRSVSQGQAWM